MTNHRTIQPHARKVIVGVDTHKHVHVAVAIDTWGIRLGDRSCAADSDGYQQLITWAERHGRVAAFGIEGTGSYGAGLARAVRRAGHQVLEVNRGDRRTRRIAALVRGCGQAYALHTVEPVPSRCGTRRVCQARSSGSERDTRARPHAVAPMNCVPEDSRRRSTCTGRTHAPRARADGHQTPSSTVAVRAPSPS